MRIVKKFYLSENLNILSSLNKSLYVDYHFKVLQMNLKKYDKFSMAHGVECRFPFLDWKLATFCFSLPENQKLAMDLQKILRDVIRDFYQKDAIREWLKRGLTLQMNFLTKH